MSFADLLFIISFILLFFSLPYQCTRAEEQICATEHFPGSSGMVTGGARMNKGRHTPAQRSVPTIEPIPTFIESILKYIKVQTQRE